MHVYWQWVLFKASVKNNIFYPFVNVIAECRTQRCNQTENGYFKLAQILIINNITITTWNASTSITNENHVLLVSASALVYLLYTYIFMLQICSYTVCIWTQTYAYRLCRRDGLIVHPVLVEAESKSKPHSIMIHCVVYTYHVHHLLVEELGMDGCVLRAHMLDHGECRHYVRNMFFCILYMVSYIYICIMLK